MCPICTARSCTCHLKQNMVHDQCHFVDRSAPDSSVVLYFPDNYLHSLPICSRHSTALVTTAAECYCLPNMTLPRHCLALYNPVPSLSVYFICTDMSFPSVPSFIQGACSNGLRGSAQSTIWPLFLHAYYRCSRHPFLRNNRLSWGSHSRQPILRFANDMSMQHYTRRSSYGKRGHFD